MLKIKDIGSTYRFILWPEKGLSGFLHYVSGDVGISHWELGWPKIFQKKREFQKFGKSFFSMPRQKKIDEIVFLFLTPWCPKRFLASHILKNGYLIYFLICY